MLQDLPLLGRDICCSDISGGCVRSVVPKKFYLNLVWSQMYTFVVYTAVPVLVTFIIFCKGDQQPPVPDSIPISSGKWYLLCLTIPMAEFHSCFGCICVTNTVRQAQTSVPAAAHSPVPTVPQLCTVSSNKQIYPRQSLCKLTLCLPPPGHLCSFCRFLSHLCLKVALVRRIWHTRV